MTMIENGNSKRQFKNSTWIRHARNYQVNNLRQFFRT